MNEKYLILLHFCELNEYKYATLKFVLCYILLHNLHEYNFNKNFMQYKPPEEEDELGWQNNV